MLLRAFGNRNCVPGGSYSVNGSGKFNDITSSELRRLKQLSVNAVWYTGIISHATRTSFGNIKGNDPSLVKGEAGSPYAIRNYFDVDPALAVNVDNRMLEFQALIERTHKAGIKVIIDFVPNHVAREYGGYFKSENYYILQEPHHLPEELHSDYVENPAKATGNNVFSEYPSVTDWYDTVKLNYESNSTWRKMLDILKFWCDKGVDGFRCDMVEMVTPDFFNWAIASVKEKHPDTLFIAEVYGKENYRRYLDAGFDYLYGKSDFYDAIRSVNSGIKPASSLSDEWKFLGDMQPHMLNFLENHDEQRVASDFYAGSARNSRAALAVSLLFNTAPFMLYCGQEFGERGMESEGFSGVDGRTSIFDYCTIPSICRFLQDKLKTEEKKAYSDYKNLLRRATADLIFSKGDTFDLMYVNPASDSFNPRNQFVWMRGCPGNAMAVAVNFGDSPVDIEFHVPREALSFFSIDGDGRSCRIHLNAKDFAITEFK